MKKTLIISIAFATALLSGRADLLPSSTSPQLLAAPHIVQRSDDHRVWESITQQNAFNGDLVFTTNSYTEIGTGICYIQDGQWVDAAPEIVIAQRRRALFTFQ